MHTPLHAALIRRLDSIAASAADLRRHVAESPQADADDLAFLAMALRSIDHTLAGVLDVLPQLTTAEDLRRIIPETSHGPSLEA